MAAFFDWVVTGRLCDTDISKN